MKPYGRERVSRQRRIIADTVSSLEHVFTVDDLMSTLEEQEHAIGQATLYRAVAALERNHFVERVGTKNGNSLYAHCDSQEHHHHLICTDCGKVSATSCPIETDSVRPSVAEGFKVTGHELTLFGICAICTDKRSGVL